MVALEGRKFFVVFYSPLMKPDLLYGARLVFYTVRKKMSPGIG